MRLALAGLFLAGCLLLLPGRGWADYDDALRAYERGQDAAALRDLAPLVSAGSPSALFLMGLMREAGRGGPKNPAEAAKLYRKAADGGNVNAMVALGVLYLRGEGVEQSDARAEDCLRKAEAKGSGRALYLLGLMRLDGRGGPAADAPGYLRRAVRAGSAEAAATLGELLLSGKGIGRNPAEAYRLALTALAGGQAPAATRSRLTALAAAAKAALNATVALDIAAHIPQGGGQPSGAPHGSQPPGGSPPGQAPEGKRAAGIRTGTGCVVSRVGHVLTNNHVAAGCKRIVAVVGGKRVAASVVRLDPRDDLALLKLAVAPPQALIFREGSQLPAAATVYAAGYPGRRALTGALRVTAGRTRDVAERAGPSGEQAVTAEVLPGNSGGPLLDAAGHVAGVVAARRDTVATQAQMGEVPSDMGFVVPLAAVKAFLAQGQVPITSAPAGRTLDTPAIFEAVSGKVIPLFCVPAGR